jgi:hypothetical protein
MVNGKALWPDADLLHLSCESFVNLISDKEKVGRMITALSGPYKPPVFYLSVPGETLVDFLYYNHTVPEQCTKLFSFSEAHKNY